jgi:hypothetical protein
MAEIPIEEDIFISTLKVRNCAKFKEVSELFGTLKRNNRSLPPQVKVSYKGLFFETWQPQQVTPCLLFDT